MERERFSTFFTIPLLRRRVLAPGFMTLPPRLTVALAG